MCDILTVESGWVQMCDILTVLSGCGSNVWYRVRRGRWLVL